MGELGEVDGLTTNNVVPSNSWTRVIGLVLPTARSCTRSRVSNANVGLRLEREVGERESAADAPTGSKSGQDHRATRAPFPRASTLESGLLLCGVLGTVVQ